MTKMIHVINDLDRISGAEAALLRCVSRQTTRPLTVISLRKVPNNVKHLQLIPSDVMVIGLSSKFGLLGSIIKLWYFLIGQPNSRVVCWMYKSNLAGAIATAFSSRHFLVWNIRHALTELHCEPFHTRLAILLNKLLARSADVVVYNSKRSMHEHENYGFPANKSLYIPNGFEIPATPTKKQKANHCLKIGHAGRFTWEKDIETLIRAFSHISEKLDWSLQLIVVGDGYSPTNKILIDFLQEKGLSIRNIEFREKTDDMRSFYEEIDLFALSSVSEGFPNVLAEAQASGVPCITTDVGDAALIVRPEFGWIVPPRSLDAFSESLFRAASAGHAYLETIGQHAKMHVQVNYSIEGISMRYDLLGKTHETS